ncbi:MAG TPA: DNA-binding protein [Candidatus Binatus sp.]|nr:DNA-binding protein [Candidatus Binatus sp.]
MSGPGIQIPAAAPQPPNPRRKIKHEKTREINPKTLGFPFKIVTFSIKGEQNRAVDGESQILMTSDLEILRQKRAAALRRRLLESQSKSKLSGDQKDLHSSKLSPREIVRKSLVGRGVEVLETARRHYPSEVAVLEENLANMIQQGRLKGLITGEELYTFLQRVGLQFNMETKIRIAEGGELKSIEDKLKGQHTDDED